MCSCWNLTEKIWNFCFIFFCFLLAWRWHHWCTSTERIRLMPTLQNGSLVSDTSRRSEFGYDSDGSTFYISDFFNDSCGEIFVQIDSTDFRLKRRSNPDPPLESRSLRATPQCRINPPTSLQAPPPALTPARGSGWFPRSTTSPILFRLDLLTFFLYDQNLNWF